MADADERDLMARIRDQDGGFLGRESADATVAEEFILLQKSASGERFVSKRFFSLLYSPGSQATNTTHQEESSQRGGGGPNPTLYRFN